MAAVALILLSACGPSSTADLIADGRGEACVADDVLKRLNASILPDNVIASVRLIPSSSSSSGNEPGLVTCYTSLQITRDGKKPWASNSIDIVYRLRSNLVDPAQPTLEGNLSSAVYEASLVLRALRATQ